MKRRKLLSLLPAIPFLSCTSFAKKEGAVESRWMFSVGETKLFDFQQQILNAVNKHDKCLFWMPRGSSKSWLISKITGVVKNSCSRVQCEDVVFYDELNERIYSDKNKRIVVLATPSENPFVNQRISTMDWDYVKKIDIYEPSIKKLYSQDLLARAKETMPQEQFEREFLAKF